MSKYYRTIAARGITPEYRGKYIGQGGEVYGKIVSFEHFSERITTVTVQKDVPWTSLVEYDFEHLEEVEVYA
jgi:hypothetical protein